MGCVAVVYERIGSDHTVESDRLSRPLVYGITRFVGTVVRLEQRHGNDQIGLSIHCAHYLQERDRGGKRLPVLFLWFLAWARIVTLSLRNV